MDGPLPPRRNGPPPRDPTGPWPSPGRFGRRPRGSPRSLRVSRRPPPWWLLQNALFDPVFPFWAEEGRSALLGSGKKPERRTIAGNFSRLADDKRDRIEYQGTVDVTFPHSSSETRVRVNYWVVKQDGETSAQAISAYVDPYRPIAFTFNGQTHGTEERRFTADHLDLNFLAKSLIIQVELDHLTAEARRELVSTTRDRLKQLSFYDVLRENIRVALSEDEELLRLNQERKEKLLSKHSEAERAKLKERFARLMERFKAGTDATVPSKGGSSGGREGGEGGRTTPPPPLPTKQEPTFLKIANVQRPVQVEIGRFALVRLESDAPDDYLSRHVHARLTVLSEPEQQLAMHSRSDFHGGRGRVVVRAADLAKIGVEGTLTVLLFTPDQRQLSAKIAFRIVKAKETETSGKTARGKIDVPDPIPIHSDEWPEHGWTEKSVAEVKEDSKDTSIFVNMDNVHINRLLKGGNYQETGLARMRNNYLLYTAFYSWVQHVWARQTKVDVDEKALDAYQEAELDRVAQLVVHSISAAGRLDEDE